MSLGMLGKYERLDVLGRGVSGIVYLARDTMLNKQVALKEVDVQAGDLRRFLEEARVMDRLRHPNIVRVNGVDRIDDKVVIDMEYVRGGNLQEMLRSRGPLPLDQVLAMSIQILDALDYAHRMQTVHRDIKPANILVDRDGNVKLADFGLAEILTTNAYAGGAGTYAYMAPEDFAEENHSDSQSDIWAVGVTMFEMLTGQRPFTVANTKSPFAWKRALETMPPTRLTDILPDAPLELERILCKALEKDKDLRYATAADFRDDLALLVDAIGRPINRGAWRNSDDTSTIDAANRWAAQDRASRTLAPVPEDATVASLGASAGKRSWVPRLLSRGREPQIDASPGELHFPAVRIGDLKEKTCKVRVANYDGALRAALEYAPPWILAEPMQFDSARQTLEVSVDSAKVSEPGVYSDVVRYTSRAGDLELPVSVTVLPQRPSFRSVAIWFVPLYLVALLPAGITSFFGTSHPTLAPPAATTSLSLFGMLLMVAFAADLGIAERLGVAAVMACLCSLLGLDYAAAVRSGWSSAVGSGMRIAEAVGFGLGLVIILQMLTLNKWRLWAGAMAIVGLLAGGALYEASTR